MNKFKRGDVVVFIQHSNDSGLCLVPVKIGRSYRILLVLNRIQIEGHGGWWFDKCCFEFEEEENE